MADAAVIPERARRPWWQRVLAWWPVVPLLVGIVLVYEAKQRYEEYVSVPAGDVVMLQIPQPRPFVVCGSDYRPGGYPGLVADRCEPLLAERSTTTRWMFWAGVTLTLAGAAFLVRRFGLRRSWPYAALGGAVACWYLFTWLLHLPLEGGACGSLIDGSESPSNGGCDVLQWVGPLDLALLVGAFGLGGTGVFVLGRRGIYWVARNPGS